MAASDCIRAKVRAGEVAPDVGEFLAKMADDFEAQAAKMGDPNAETTGLVRAAEAARWQLASKRNARRYQAYAQQRAIDDIGAVEAGRSRKRRAMSWLFPRFDEQNAPMSIWAQHQLHASRSMARMAEVIEELRPKMAGLSYNRELEIDVLRAIYGEPTQREGSQEMAQAVQAALDYFPEQYRKFGITLPTIERYLPQRHSSVRTEETPRDEWVEFMFNRADREAMIDRDTGQSFTDDKLRETLGRMYDSIISGDSRSRSFIDKLLRERFFVFNSSDGYREWLYHYSDDSSLMDALAGYVQHSAMDLARVETFGPSPNATVQAIQDTTGGAKTSMTQFDRTYTVMSGIQNGGLVTGSKWNNLPKYMAAARHINGANILGSAAMIAFTDTAFMSNALRTASVRMPFTRAAFRTVGNILNPNARRDRIRARKMLFGAESAMARQGSVQKLEHDEVVSNFPLKLQDTVLRATGLTAITDNIRRTGYEMFLMNLTEKKSLRFDQLPAQLQQSFRRFQIDERQWDVIRNNVAQGEDGFEFIDPDNLIEVDEEAGRNMMRYANRLLEAGSPITDPESRALLTQALPADEFGGQLLRMVNQLAFWPTAILRNQTQLLSGSTGYMTGAKMAGLTIMQAYGLGLIISQLRDVTEGKRPRSIDNESLHWDAFFRSGVTGILGDYLWSAMNRGEMGFAASFAGPTAGFFGSAANLTFGNLKDAIEGEDTHFGRDMVNFMEDMTPGKSGWYAQLAMERLIFDQLQGAVDPNAAESFRAERRFVREEEGTKFFMPPER